MDKISYKYMIFSFYWADGIYALLVGRGAGVWADNNGEALANTIKNNKQISEQIYP
jgi:hypothetical protein